MEQCNLPLPEHYEPTMRAIRTDKNHFRGVTFRHIDPHGAGGEYFSRY